MLKSKNNEFSTQNILKLNNDDIISTRKHEKYEFCIGGMEPKCNSVLRVVQGVDVGQPSFSTVAYRQAQRLRVQAMKNMTFLLNK